MDLAADVGMASDIIEYLSFEASKRNFAKQNSAYLFYTSDTPSLI